MNLKRNKIGNNRGVPSLLIFIFFILLTFPLRNNFSGFLHLELNSNFTRRRDGGIKIFLIESIWMFLWNFPGQIATVSKALPTLLVVKSWKVIFKSQFLKRPF